MWKQKIAIVALVSFLLPAVAAARVLPYMQVGPGVINGQWAVKDTSGKRTPFSMDGSIVGASFGLGSALNRYVWFAVEAFGNYSAVRTRTKNIIVSGSAATLSMHQRWSYGISVNPGLIIGSGLLFARIGALQTRVIVKQSVVPAGYNSPNNSSLQEAGILGAGIQANFASNWGVRAEYDRIMYRHFTAFSNRISPFDSEVRAGLIYNFV